MTDHQTHRCGVQLNSSLTYCGVGEELRVETQEWYYIVIDARASLFAIAEKNDNQIADFPALGRRETHIL